MNRMQRMKEIHIDTTTIALLAIPDGSGGTHREREREAVREIIRRVLGEGVEIVHDRYGAPRVNVSSVNISVSHSFTAAAVAFDSVRPVGIDIERWRPQLRRVAERFLTESELAREVTDDCLLRAWTAKEATYKVAGVPELMLRDIEYGDNVCRAANSEFAIWHCRVGDNLLAVSVRREQ